MLKCFDSCFCVFELVIVVVFLRVNLFLQVNLFINSSLVLEQGNHGAILFI